MKKIALLPLTLLFTFTLYANKAINKKNHTINTVNSKTLLSNTTFSNFQSFIQYFKPVQSENNNEYSGWSSIISLSKGIDDLDAPVLNSPLNGVIDQPTELTLDWNSVSSATNYEYQYSTNISFTTYWNDYTSDTESLITGLNNNYMYYWRVRASDGSNWSDWSEIWNFTTEEAGSGLSTPVLISPTNGAINQVTSPTLLWNVVPTAIEYEYQYSTDNTFATYNGSTTQSTSISIGILDYNTEYFWRIKATDGYEFSDWSEVWSFTTEEGYLDAPVLVSPSNGATNQQIELTLNWNSVTDATEYEYQYSTDNTFAVFDNGTTSNTDIEISELDYNTEYFWRVQASGGNVLSEWSSVWSFTTTTEISIDFINNKNIEIFPNPVRNILYFNSNIYISGISVYSIIGKKMYEKNNTTDSFINTNKYPEGIYIVNFKVDEGIVSKIILIKH